MEKALLDLSGVGPAIAGLLAEAGFSSVLSIAQAEPGALTVIRGIGPARAASLRNEAQRLVGQDEPQASATHQELEEQARRLRKDAKQLRKRARRLTKKAKATKSKKKRKQRQRKASKLEAAARKARRKAKKLLGE